MITQIISEIQNNKKKIHNLEIILGNFDTWGGSYYLTKEKYDELFKYAQSLKYQKKNTNKKVTYVYYDKKLIIDTDKNKKNYIRESLEVYKKYPNLIAMIKDSRKIDQDRFPIISKYSDIKYETIQEYIFDDNIRLQFIIENTNNYAIVIKFREINSIDLDKLSIFNLFAK